MRLAEHFTVVHSFSVHLLIGETEIGEGRVAHRTKYIHQNILLDSELKVQLTKVNYKKMDHPDYSYQIESGGFTAWPKEDCR